MYKLEYSPALDGLRAVLAFAVFAFHFSSFGMHTFRGGFLAVDAFFVLSGFLITSILVEEFEARGRIAIGRFLTRRSARLFPAAWVVLLAVAVVQGL